MSRAATVFLFAVIHVVRFMDCHKAAAAQSSNVTLMRVPNGGIQPQVVRQGNGTIHMVYFKGKPTGGDLFYVHSDGGEKFSEPLRVNSRPNAMAIGNIRGAHLAVGRSGRVHVAWFGAGEADRAGPSKKETPMLYPPQRRGQRFRAGTECDPVRFRA